MLLSNARVDLVVQGYLPEAHLIQYGLSIRQIKGRWGQPLHASLKLCVVPLDVFEKLRYVAVFEHLLTEEQFMLVLKDQVPVGHFGVH